MRLRSYNPSLPFAVSSATRVCSRYPFLFALIVAALCLRSPNLFAQSRAATPLTLDQCIALAKDAPSAVKRARLQEQATQFGIRGAKANFLPQLSIANTFTYNSPLLYNHNEMSFVALNGLREYATLGTASLELDTSGRLRAMLDRARANEQIARADLTITDRDLRRDVAFAYYRLLLARQLAGSAHTNLSAAQEFEQRVEKLVSGEEASRADLSKATLEAALLERTAEASDLEAQMAKHDLASYWTTDVTNPLMLAGDLDETPASPVNVASDRPYLHRPEFGLLDAQIFGYKADARQAFSRMLPQLSATYQYGLDTNQVTTRNRGYAGFVHLEVPVFDWLKARSEQQQFRLQASQIETDKAIATRLYSKEFEDALASVNSSYQQAMTTEREVKAAEENLRLSRLRFEGGEGLALDVVTSQNSLVQAQIDFYSARANYLNAQSALKVANAR